MITIKEPAHAQLILELLDSAIRSGGTQAAAKCFPVSQEITEQLQKAQLQELLSKATESKESKESE